MSIFKDLKIAILLGGTSQEREISIKTGLGVANALGNTGVELVYLGQDIQLALRRLEKADLVFNALHGGSGEDGHVQALMTMMGIRYTGSAMHASALAMDKNVSKIIARNEGVETANWRFLSAMTKNSLLEACHNRRFPLMLKPNAEGSSVGLAILHSTKDIDSAYDTVKDNARDFLLEDFVSGRELTVAVVNGKALPIVEIMPKSGLYDYEAKYEKGASEYACPANVSSKVAAGMQADAVAMFRAFGCRHYARFDFRMDVENRVFFLEGNTLPGLTETSLIPKAAQQVGMTYAQLVTSILEMAMTDEN